MYGLMALEGRDIVEELNADSVYTLGTGTALHHQFQNHYLAKLGRVYQGWWRCKECLTVARGEERPVGSMLSHGWIPKPESCPHCKRETATPEQAQGLGLEGTTDFESIELEFVNTDYPITGHCDGVLDWREYEADPQDFVEALEIKSIHPRGFSFVDPMEGGSVKTDHIVQAQGYLWGLEGTGIDQCRIFYVAKEFERPMAQTFAEHVIRRDQGIIGRIQAVLTRSRQTLRDMDEWRARDMALEGEKPPPIPDRLHMCTKKSDKHTKYCPMRDQCFPRKTAKKKVAKKKAAKKKAAKKQTATA
jgi:hypothetical protein